MQCSTKTREEEKEKKKKIQHNEEETVTNMRYQFKYNDNHFKCELSNYSNFKILRDDIRLKGFT